MTPSWITVQLWEICLSKKSGRASEALWSFMLTNNQGRSRHRQRQSDLYHLSFPSGWHPQIYCSQWGVAERQQNGVNNSTSIPWTHLLNYITPSPLIHPGFHRCSPPPRNVSPTTQWCWKLSAVTPSVRMPRAIIWLFRSMLFSCLSFCFFFQD